MRENAVAVFLAELGLDGGIVRAEEESHLLVLLDFALNGSVEVLEPAVLLAHRIVRAADVNADGVRGKAAHYLVDARLEGRDGAQVGNTGGGIVAEGEPAGNVEAAMARENLGKGCLVLWKVFPALESIAHGEAHESRPPAVAAAVQGGPPALVVDGNGGEMQRLEQFLKPGVAFWMLAPVYLKAQIGPSAADFHYRENEAQAIAKAAHRDDAEFG